MIYVGRNNQQIHDDGVLAVIAEAERMLCEYVHGSVCIRLAYTGERRAYVQDVLDRYTAAVECGSTASLSPTATHVALLRR